MPAETTHSADMLKNNQKSDILPQKNNQKQSKLPPVFDHLNFVRLKIPRLIPLSLVENVKGRTFTPEQFFVYQEKSMDNPFNHLFVLIDEAKKIHGYLWVEQNCLDNSLFLNTFSISKQYWGKGEAIGPVIEFMKTMKDALKAPRIFWCTTNKKFFQKHGFRESKITLMEYDSN